MCFNNIEFGLWGSDIPRFSVSAITLCNYNMIISGSCEGYICTWEIRKSLDNKLEIYLKHFIFAHNCEVTKLACSFLNDYSDSKFVSLAINGEISCWKESDGTLISTSNLLTSITNIISFSIANNGKKVWTIVAFGCQSDVLIINPLNMEIITVLQNYPSSDWNYACCHILLNSHSCLFCVSVSGKIKIWSEVHSKTSLTTFMVVKEQTPHLDICNLKYVTSSPQYPHLVLFVCNRMCQIVNIETFEVIFERISKKNQQTWISGEFISNNRILMFDKYGGTYLYGIDNKDPNEVHQSLISSAIKHKKVTNFYSILGSEEFILQGNNLAEISIHRIDPTPNVNESMVNIMTKMSLQEVWLKFKPCSVLDELNPSLHKDSNNIHSPIIIGITCSIYLSYFGFSVFGRSDGSIIIMNTIKAVSAQLLDLKDEKTSFVCLNGHKDKISAFLHPFSHNQRYQSNYLVSGSFDHTIRVWDLISKTQIAIFCNHATKITHLLISQSALNLLLKYPVISIAHDYSVSLISLDSMATYLIAPHSSQVQSIYWNIRTHLMITSCLDGNLYFWNYDEGILDCVMSGSDAHQFIEIEEFSNTKQQSFKKNHHSKFSISNTQTNWSLLSSNDNLNSLLNKSKTLSHFGSNPNIVATEMNSTSTNSIKHSKYRMNSKVSIFPLFNHNSNFISSTNYEISKLNSNYNNHSTSSYTYHGSTSIKDNFQTSPHDNDPNKNLLSDYSSIWHHQPLYMVPFKISRNNYEMHILVIDIEMLLAHFNHDEEFKANTSPESNISNNSLLNLNYIHLSDDYEVLIQALEPAITSKDYLRFINAYQKLSRRCLLLSSRLLLSCLTAWDVGSELNSICCDKLGFIKPKTFVYYGSNSTNNRYCIILPGWTPTSMINHQNQNKTQSNDYVNSHFMFNEEMSSNHIVTIVALANSFLSYGNRISFLSDNVNLATASSTKYTQSVQQNTSITINSSSVSGSSSLNLPMISNPNYLNSKPTTQLSSKMQIKAQVKASWSFLAAVHCCMLNDLFQKSNFNFISPSLPILIQRWQDSGIEIREASQAIILAEMRRIGPSGRIKLIEYWYPKVLKINFNINDIHSNSSSDLITNEFSTQNVAAVFVLAVIGAEFQKELDPLLTNNSTTSSQMNSDCLRMTAQYLLRWVQRRSSSLTIALSSTRRIAVELIGRGFSLWEPYIDSGHLIVSILELITRLDLISKQGVSNSKINMIAVNDLAKSTRLSLNIIAQTRPGTFISTLLKEIARYSMNSWSNHNQSITSAITSSNLKLAVQPTLFGGDNNSDSIKNIILYSRKDIIKTLELMIDKCPHDIYNFLVEVVDIVCHCVDYKSMKDKGLLEMFPLLSRYHMISHCNHSRRLAVGTKNGQIGIFELRSNKYNLMNAHNSPINCLAFSPDGKFLVSFSQQDGKIFFWQSIHSLFGNIFTINTSQSSFKCISTYDLASNNKHHVLSSISNNNPNQCINIFRRSCRLSWTDNRSIVLILNDGVEMKFSI